MVRMRTDGTLGLPVKPKPPLNYLTGDSTGTRPDGWFIGLELKHLGNERIYRIVGFAWMGATDEWGFLHHEVRGDGLDGVMLCRPLSHIEGNRSNGERRYSYFNRVPE